MRAYVDGGLKEEDGGVVLKCSPESEAEFFMAATDHRAWDRLGEVTSKVILLAGEHSTTHGAAFLSELQGRFPDARSEVIVGTSHFVWMEAPGAVANHLAQMVG